MDKHVVVIYAHPDDESFGAAGSILNYRKKGVPVTYLCGTLGEMGRNMGSPTFANRETLPRIRARELEEVGQYLDINIRLLGYRDKTLEFEDQETVAAHIKDVLGEIKPSLVITHYPGYAVHPDHDALGAATIKAVEMMSEDKRPTVWAQAITHDYQEVLGEPDIVHDVTDIFDDKMASILVHRSQAEGMLKEMQGDPDIAENVKQDLKMRLGKEQFYVWSFSNEK